MRTSSFHARWLKDQGYAQRVRVCTTAAGAMSRKHDGSQPRCKFQIKDALKPWPATKRNLLRVPRACDIVTTRPILVRKRIQKLSVRSKTRTMSRTSGSRLDGGVSSASVLSMLLRPGQHEAPPELAVAKGSAHEPRVVIGDDSEYITNLLREISSGYALQGKPWVFPPDPYHAAAEINRQRQRDEERLIDAREALNLVLRPTVFVWAPDKLFPGLSVLCPLCRQPMSSSEWWRRKTLHTVTGCCAYITMRYSCRCQALRKQSSARFLGDAPAVMALLPKCVTSKWDLVNAGKLLCDASIIELVRAMATRTSWSAITEAMNELKSTSWTKNVIRQYFLVCETLRLRPLHVPACLPKEHRLSSDWIRNLFVADVQGREQEVAQELTSEKGDDLLIFDWTQGAATRCGSSYIFNAMDGAGRILVSQLTETCGPCATQPIVLDLARRGVKPLIVYVDDECCGAWRTIVGSVWPNAFVRLDGWHAMQRLTQSVTSLQHPLHPRFCADLADALYTRDEQITTRLRRARAREGTIVSRKDRAKFVPRVIADAEGIVASVEAVLRRYNESIHAQAGPLLTPETHRAWSNLKAHVKRGCLCDPPGVVLNEVSDVVIIGGEEFQTVRSRRGTSALEGYHSHQKQWFGLRAHHAADAGQALLTEGVLRWNRNKRNALAVETDAVPPVFTRGLLRTVDELHQNLTRSRFYQELCKPRA